MGENIDLAPKQDNDNTLSRFQCKNWKRKKIHFRDHSNLEQSNGNGLGLTRLAAAKET